MNFNVTVSNFHGSSQIHTKYKLFILLKSTKFIIILQLNRTQFITYIEQEDKSATGYTGSPGPNFRFCAHVSEGIFPF